MPNYQNVTKFKCLIQEVSQNVSKSNEMEMHKSWNATQCYKMLRNVDAEKTECGLFHYTISFHVIYLYITWTNRHGHGHFIQ